MKKIVLVVDDDKTDVMAIQRALQSMVLKNEIEVEVFNDGDEVIARLKDGPTTEAYKDSPVPYIMFLDLNMPKMDGLEVLEVVRSDPKLKSMVIFVLTTSNNPTDIKKAYQKCIAGYLVKSEQGNRYEKLKDLVQSYSNAVTPPIEY
ncbi:MAG: CheY-like chemotaxis protein [Nitrospinales bacterium]|jgi:CheY-like chemotaxis protein